MHASPMPMVRRTIPAATAVFDDAKSEFSALVKLWRGYRKAREGTRREVRRWCKERGLSVLRLSEWEDVHAQVVDRAGELGIVAQPKPASYTGVHRALLAGFCTMVGTRGEDGVYLGTRGVHFHLFPGSPLRRRRARWVMAANIVETSRVFARRVAEIEPMWVESAAHHLLKREYLEPDWDEGREEVVARERLSYLGLILSANRVVNYGPIAPEESRLIFAREALVYGRLSRRPDWVRLNDGAILEAQRMEERLRTRDLVRASDAFVEFYDRVLPRQVSSTATLDNFTRHLDDAGRAALRLGPEIIFARAPDAEALAQFPERVVLPALHVPVQYRFAPGESRDGATLNVPLLALPTLTRVELDAAVPGLAAPRVEALLRSLPKDARRALIPIGAAAAGFMDHMGAPSTSVVRLGRWLTEVRGIPAPSVRFDLGAVPAHLTAQVAVFDEGRELAQGSDLGVLRRRCAERARAALDARARESYPARWRRFELEELPSTQRIALSEGDVPVFPTLVPVDGTLAVRFEWTAAEAAHRWREGGVRLARAMLERQDRDFAKKLASDTQLLLAASPYAQSATLSDALLQWVFRRACFKDADAPRNRAAFDAAVDQGRESLYPALQEISAGARGWFTEARAVRRLLDDPRARSSLAALAQESHAHLQRLLEPGALAAMPVEWVRQLPRHVKAEERRWQRLFARGSEAGTILRDLTDWTARLAGFEAQLAAERRWLPELEELRFWIEEFRVSLYAQELKTLGPVSAARLSARAAEIDGWLMR